MMKLARASGRFIHGYFAEFRNAVPVIVVRVQVDGSGNVFDNDVSLPAGVFVPGQLGSALIDSDQIGLAVTVQVGDDELIAHL